jgi:outer membrane protein OmpA-like peptidoglycan-associated protein
MDMSKRISRLTIGFLCIVLGFAWTPAEAQFFKKLKDTVLDAAEDETNRQVQKKVEDAVACAFNDLACIDKAKKNGDDVVLTDSNGEVIKDDAGQPITDPNQAAAQVGEPASSAEAADRPGQGVWANYDFVPGDEVLFAEDFSIDQPGDFPRRLRFKNGNMEVVEWQGEHWLRTTTGSAFSIELPEELPERFTLEYKVAWSHGNQWMRVLFKADDGRNWAPRKAGSYTYPHLQVDERKTGIFDFQGDSPYSLTPVRGKITEGAPPTMRLMADGEHVKVYVDEKRVANIPQVDIGRSKEIWFLLADGSDKNPIFISSIRVAGGGADLYDKLAEEGRVTTRGIFFASNSAQLRPESTPTLKDIGKMLTKHEDLRISIEGHTDSSGDEAHNRQLSEQRAESVKRYLMETYGIAANRLETAGYGESQPVADNESPEGRQNNRRVELVKLG